MGKIPVTDSRPPDGPIIDYITGTEKPNTGAEVNRQLVERVLVEIKGFDPLDIEVDLPIVLEMEDGPYASCLDLVVSVAGRRYMVIKCAPGSLASREREVIAAARLADRYQIPLAIASDGKTAMVWETVSGKILGQDMQAVPSKTQAEKMFDPAALVPLDERLLYRVQLIFKSYDSMYVNR
jgi:hypothetical protein